MKTQSPAQIERGFSIVEILVGLLAVSLLSAGAYRLYVFFSKQNLTQQRIAAGQNELLPIQKTLEKNLRRASYGIPLISSYMDSTGSVKSKDAIAPSDNGSNPDGILIRGNFSNVKSQLKQPLPLAATAMSLQSGTAGDFSVGDWVVLDMGEKSEHIKITNVDTTASQLGVGARINAYTAGTNVIKVTSVEFKSENGILTMVGDRTSVLTSNLENLRFYFHQQNGIVDSTAPYDIKEIKSISYLLTLRIQKPGSGGYLYREATGDALLRNIPL